MIEYFLIFALGFCAAALLALVVAPAIHRRIVTLTERRMRATVALTAAEVRAEKAAERARDAAANSRLSQQLRQEREGRDSVTVERERLAMQLASARKDQADLDERIRELSQTRDALNDDLRRRGDLAEDLRAALSAAQMVASTKDRYIEELTGRAEVLAGDLDRAQADIAMRDKHADMMRERIEKLQLERSALREEVKEATEAAGELRIRLERELSRAESLDEKLSARIAELSDREGALEHSNRTAAELGERLAAETKARREAEERLHDMERDLARLRQEARDREGDIAPARSQQEKVRTMNGRSHESAAISRRIERLRRHHAKLLGSLSEAGNGENDARLREEIAEVAAMMVDLTAAREGPSSPIHRILAAQEHEDVANPSLAERARRQIQASADGE